MQANQKYNFIRKYCVDYKIAHLLVTALLLLISNYAALGWPEDREVEAKKLLKPVIRQLNEIDGNDAQFNNYCNRIVILTKFDYDLKQQILADSLSEVKKLLKNAEYTKAQDLLSLALRLDQSDDAVKVFIVLKAELAKFNEIEPIIMEHFDIASPLDPSWWHFNLDKAEILTYAAQACEKYSNPDLAEHFYRMAIQHTTCPISPLGWDDWDDVADKCYYWARMYNQACLGQLLANRDDKTAGLSILFTVRDGLNCDHPLTRKTNPQSKSYFNNLFVRMCALEWKRDRDKTYTVLKMAPKDESLI